MWIKLLLSGLGLLLAGLVVVVVVEWARLDQNTAEVVDDLLAAAEERPGRVVQASDVDDLPPPVRRYLRHVLRDGQPVVETVRIEQSGTFRAGGAGSPWRPFTATQHVTTRPPGFVWDAAIEMMPLVSVRVLDAYHDGRGVLQARVGGVLPVMDAAPSPELDEGELLRYLAEAPLYPTALLPGMGVTWTPIDDRSARATLIDRGTTASLIFHVNDRNEVARVTGERSFTRDDGTSEYRPWIGYWRAYDDRGGVRVPTEGEVAWTYPDAGEVSYWRGRIETVLYRDATASEDRRAF
jgi:hypothetical protein